MAAVDTKKVFDEYFASLPESTTRRIRASVDRPEVYEYETKTGKQLFDMTVDELFEMLSTFGNKTTSKSRSYKGSYSSYYQISSIYRNIWEYYIENYEVIRNPWNNKRMRGEAGAKVLIGEKDSFSKKNLDEIIDKIYGEYSIDNAKYLECLLLLFYDGFANSAEIVNLKEEMISFRTRDIQLPGRTITLSQHTFDLLLSIHKMEEMEGWRGDFVMKSYRGGYFKFIVRPREANNLDLREPKIMYEKVSRTIIRRINEKFDININPKLLYYLGMYDKMCSKYGSEKAKELISSKRNQKATSELRSFMHENGLNIDNVYMLRQNLRPYID